MRSIIKFAAMLAVVVTISMGLAGPVHASSEGRITQIRGIKDTTRLPNPAMSYAPRAGKGELAQQDSPTGADGALVWSNAFYKASIKYSKVTPGKTLRLYVNGHQVAQKAIRANDSGYIDVSSVDLTYNARVGWNTLTTNLSNQQFKLFRLGHGSGISVYQTNGQHYYNNRYWRTGCLPYSQTVRCTTETRYAGGEWVFNNLTYLPGMTRAQWGSNPLANPGTWTSGGRSWRTECDTAATGRNGCRSYIWSGGAWVFNSMVQFKNA